MKQPQFARVFTLALGQFCLTFSASIAVYSKEPSQISSIVILVAGIGAVGAAAMNVYSYYQAPPGGNVPDQKKTI